LYDVELERRFYQALKIETTLAAEQWGDSETEIATIYIGGGTPSLTDIDLFSDWLTLLKRLFAVSVEAEFSIEHNPESVTAERLALFRQLGCNRPVFGVQSFQPRLLKLLGRAHGPKESHRAVYLANVIGYENFGLDLLYGLPTETSKMLSSDLDQLLDLDPPHISFYQLTIESGTRLADRVMARKLRPASRKAAAAMYRAGCDQMTDKGYSRYEVSSFAKPGFECKHNLNYWEGSDYLGLGPSANSFIDNRRFLNRPAIGEYIEKLEQRIRPLAVDDSRTGQRMTEAIMLGLRTARGINRRAFAARFGLSVEELLDRTQYDMLVESGRLIPDKGNLRLSEDSLSDADDITRKLLK
jgi:oxygen-independent coproporphyrinogen-3 oxidase